MATANSPSSINRMRRHKVMLGKLPPDFLRITSSSKLMQEAADQQTALALQHHLAPPTSGRLDVTIDQARLVKNYGMTRMDPYVRLRVGHFTYDTHTDPSGGKNPHWNKIIQCLLPQGVTHISIEIFDECSFSMDNLIAHTQISIPKEVLAGQVIERWYPLSGKQGDDKEGSINVVLSYSPGYYYGSAGPVMMVSSTGGQNFYGMPQLTPFQVYPHTANNTSVEPTVVDEKLYEQMEEMFPNIDKDVVKSICDTNNGDKERIINSLLQICE